MSQKAICWLIATWIVFVTAQLQLNVNDKLLKIIEQYIDTTKDPCDDYFSYACGKWSEKHKSGRYSETTGLVDHKINKRLVNILEAYKYGQNEITDKVWTYYKSCRYERKRRLNRYLKIVKPDNGLNWPLMQNKEKWHPEKFNWLKTVARLRRYGLNKGLIEHTVLQNGSDTSNYVIELDSPSINDLNQLSILMFTIFDVLDIDSSLARKWVPRIKLFEEQLQELRDIEDEYGVLAPTVQDMENDFPDWSWKEYFQIILELDVPEDYTFQVRNGMYFIGLAELLSKTDPELICNYLMVRFLLYLAFDRSSSADKIDCMVDVRSKMDLAMNFIYAERFYKEESEVYNDDVQKIVNVIRDDLRKKLNENRLKLASDEMEFLKAKLDTMRVNMGNLPKHIDNKFILQYYKNIYLDRKNYYKNHLLLLKLRFLKDHEPLLKGRPDPNEYFFVADSDTARSSTPFYIFHQNLIVIPYGFLQTPIYHHNIHDVLKYSLLGFNLAHEMAHGFDASGVLYDSQGILSYIGKNITETGTFTDALLCMERNETTSLDERIADIVGLRLAYDAFFKSKRDFENQNLTFNGKSINQIFFLNYAQFFCGNMASEFLDHDSDNIRLQESLSNFEAFAEAYHCDINSQMNPQEKCRLW